MKNHEKMFKLAIEVAAKAYNPYSNFQVGACIRTINNSFFTGCNIENASFSLTICAENSALANMITNGEREIAEILIVGSSNDFCFPCGACRQALIEFSNKNTLVHACSQNGESQTIKLVDLLPHTFILQK